MVCKASVAALVLLLLPAAGALPTADVMDTDVDAALGDDDHCATSGEGVAHCALNALQLKTAQPNASAVVEMGGTCQGGIMGQMHKLAPSCLDSCSQSCGALAGAVAAYMKGGVQATEGAVCAQEGAFRCFLSGGNHQKCQPLISKAATLGVHLPSSPGELAKRCR